jgi:hypothetical protein
MLDRTQLVLRRVVKFLAGDNHSGILLPLMRKRRDSLQNKETVDWLVRFRRPLPQVLFDH